MRGKNGIRKTLYTIIAVIQTFNNCEWRFLGFSCLHSSARWYIPLAILIAGGFQSRRSLIVAIVARREVTKVIKDEVRLNDGIDIAATGGSELACRPGCG
jgi:hypothetical protein